MVPNRLGTAAVSSFGKHVVYMVWFKPKEEKKQGWKEILL